MNDQNNEIDPSSILEKENEEQTQGSSVSDAINPDPIDLAELVSDLGKSVLDFASSVVDNISIDL
nr:hypothetical protein [Acinetobacter sp. Marseille-Q1620]